MRKLEHAYSDTIAVIGVHSAKYTAESRYVNARQAVQRFGISHPVVNDPDHAIWDAFAVKAWPTLILISPSGQVIASHEGEISFEDLSSALDELIAEYAGSGTLHIGPLAWRVESPPAPSSGLLFPGKVLASHGFLFVADSGHNRIIVATHDGAVAHVVGNGEPGFRDGPFDFAQLNQPQGMAFHPATRTLFVADAANHAIRAIDLDAHSVRTIAGSGRQASRVTRSGQARETALASPWDLALHGSALYVAMAGLHQVWLVDLDSSMVSAWAGTGHEATRDGPRANAWFAQPMGLSIGGGALYVACAEAQAIRRVDIALGIVSTVVGGGLFAFGDADGPVPLATLQHCQDVAYATEGIYVADTNNNKIKMITGDPLEVNTILGANEEGCVDGPALSARLWEPAGLGVANGILYIADTNNHRIRAFNPRTGMVHTLQFEGL
ncbi:MAG: thioredoxin-like domain-containing protein [Chloroflexota bacterium]